tara:strand:+ start:2390 stop:3217 length:828 start_codon:yes stop_codon:yes gene_type:complete
MRRNNEDRTKTRRAQDNAIDPASVLDFVTPTEFVELPSKGIGYPSGHPLYNKETVEIRFMTAKDEDILTSRSLLKKGVALERLIDNLLVDKTFGSKDILVGDRNAIIIAARSSAYGHLYETKVQCPACQTSNKVTFDLSNPFIYEGDLTEFNVEETETGSYVATTPKSNIKVEMRLMTGHDEGKILKMVNANKKEEEIVSSQMKLYIKSVNGHSEAVYINYFVENVPAYEARWLRKCYETLAPNIKISEDFICDNCGHQQEMEVPFNTDFFWPDH